MCTELNAVFCCEQTNRINALLKRCYRYGYAGKIHCMSDLLNSVDLALFDKMHSEVHCLYPLLHPVRNQLEHLRSRGGMNLLYPHTPKIFTRHHSSCVVCLTLCNNHTIVLFYCITVLHNHFSHASSIMFLPISICSISCTITHAFVMCQ